MSKQILIVDDSATAIALFRACLAGQDDYHVCSARTWQGALDKTKEEEPFLIVLDYNMPEKVGTEIAEQLIRDGNNAHLVLLTANTQQHIVDEAKNMGFVDVIEKPVSTEALLALLEKLS